MKTRLIKNYVTTLLGVAALSFAALMQYKYQSPWTELSGWYAFGLMLLRSKDSLIGLGKRD